MPAVIGKPAPAFTANAVQPDGSFKPVKLSDYKGAARAAARRCGGSAWKRRLGARSHAPARRLTLGKYVVLFFYPLDFTFVCPVRAAGRDQRSERPN